jgi:alkyl hydroperoxide reductase subunit AhpC
MLSNIMVQLGNHTNAQVEENMVRHMCLNSIRMYKTKFGPEYGEFVIACDNKNYWRKQLFPYYKANRKKSQAASELDWKAIFECLNKIRGELKEHFPYRIIDVESAEADDIIGTLCIEFGNTNEKILILSGDKDFQQLQRYINIRQYNPVLKKFITCNDPDKFLAEHILKGDAGDGIPNILSDDNCFVLGSRQKPMTQKKMDDLIALGLDGKFDHTNFRNYMRNKQLIDLTQVPEDIKLKVLESYDAQANKKSSNLLNYFIANRLKNLTESIQDFT